MKFVDFIKRYLPFVLLALVVCLMIGAIFNILDGVLVGIFTLIAMAFIFAVTEPR